MTTNPNVSTSEELVRLAERMEQASGADRVLDAAVWLHLPEQAGHAWKHAGNRYKHAHQIAGCGWVPACTAFLDAAMSLVPKGWEQFDVDATAPELGIDWTLHQGKVSAKATAATPALALTAAALRAHAALREGEG